MGDLEVARFTATKQYDKAFAKLSPKAQARVRQALEDALADIDAPRLHLHSLAGQWLGVFSINAGGDLRVLFEAVDEDGRPADAGSQSTTGLLITVGTHAQLYG
ncbi:MAG: type II toxin-antitoxin system RelE/ParE family toxin [Propionibacteriaceae bacterium]|jgi:mRNA-degrading endonuclease YafQ of YafQ-DinJ toxin-antitoxin module|nr:type II toxin-antitoxin system RelE/ParE family toxin [Propionibacteriaceae bacterium]